MAYEAEQIAVDGISIMQLDKMEIHCAPGGHGRCRLSGYVAADSGEAVIYGMQENLPLKVSAGGSLIFSGLVTYARVSGMGVPIMWKQRAGPGAS